MKKVFLLSAVAGMVAFTSCKKETNEAIGNDIEQAGQDMENAANETGAALQEGANDLVEGVDEVFEDGKALLTDSPKVENEQLQEVVNKMHDEALKAKTAAASGNQEELNEAVATMASLKEQMETFQGQPDYDEAAAYYMELKAELE